MEKFKIVSLVSLVILLSNVAIVLASGRDEFPRLDWAEGIVATSDEALELVGNGSIDNFKDVPTRYVGYLPRSWHISIQPSFRRTSFGGLFINCRDYTPDGMPLIPLNITQFRYALHLLIGCKKTEWINWNYSWRTDTIFPWFNLYWYKQQPQVPYDPVQAYQLLISAGFSNSTGIWIMPNGQELRKIRVMSPEESPPLIILTGYCVDSWNAFFGKGSDGQHYFIHDPTPFYDILDHVFIYRDYDVAFLPWTFGRDPDFLYDMFHPNGSANAPGLDLPLLNNVLHAVKYWRWPNGTFITTFEEMRQLVSTSQDILFNATPVIPLYFSGAYINAYAPSLQCWTESPGFSSNNFWTYNWIGWTQPSPSPGWRFHIPSPLPDLNPITSTSRSSWQILDLIIDNLIQIEPFAHSHVLWAAKQWTPLEGYEPFTEPGVEHGMKVTFELRQGIKWHDNVTVNAETIKYNLDFIKQIMPPRLQNVWKTYLRAVVQEPPNDKITIHINGTETGFWPIYDYVKAALLIPPHIYCPYGPVDLNMDGEVTYDEVLAFKPDKTPHPLVPGLTCLIGTGPWIFKGWVNENKILLEENENYFAHKFLREDTNFDGKVDITDIGLVLRAFGAMPGHPRWMNGRTDVNCDGKVDMTDIGKILRKYGKITLPDS